MKDFDQKEMDRFISEFIEVIGLETDPDGRPNMYLIRDEDGDVQHGIDFDEERVALGKFILDSYARRDAMMREELLGRMPKDKNIASGEGLPFENSPEIYGNERMVAYARGYNEGKAEITSIINDVLS